MIGLVLGGLLLGQARSRAVADPVSYVEFAESAPVTANGARFQIVAQTPWHLRASGSSVEIQVRVTNQTSKDFVFPLFDTFHIHLKRANGTEIPDSGGRDRTAFVPPILLHPGQTYTVCRSAELKHQEAGKPADFFYYDGTGSVAWFRGPDAGKYAVSFTFTSTREIVASGNFGPGRSLPGGKVPPFWYGTATTPDAPIAIVTDAR